MSEKLKKKDKTLLNLVFKSWFMQASLNYVWQIKKLGAFCLIHHIDYVINI